MTRIVFDLPPHFGFATDLQIYISHVNQGYREGHVDGAAIVVGDMLAQYKSEAFHGETLRVRMQPADFNRYGFDLVFRMTELSTGREVARGKTGIVFIDPGTRRVTAIPGPAHRKLLACAQAAATVMP